MFWSLTIGRIAGTAIRVHITFILLLGWIFVASWVADGPAMAWNSLAFVLLLFACVVAHEFGHIFMARRFGVNTPDVILLPIGGVSRLERIPEKPSEEFLIAIAGPAVNVVIALLLVVLLGASLNPGDLTSVESTQISMIDRLAIVNVFLVVFNAIPAFPMDGGRVLRALLASRLGYVRATEIAASIGQVLAFVFGFVGLLYNPLLIFIAIFVYLAASSEAQLVHVRAMSRGVPVAAAMMTQFATLATGDSIDHAVETLLRTSQGEFPVVDGVGKPVGVLGRSELIRAVKERGPDARVAEAMNPNLPTVRTSGRLEDTFRMLQEKSAPAVGVVDNGGKLVGLITSETIGEMLMVQDALPRGVRLGPWSRPAA